MAETPEGFAADPSPKNPRTVKSNWRGSSATPSKGKLIGLTFVLLLAVGGAIGGLFLWPKAAVEPRFRSLPIDQYGPLWPVHETAARDADLLVSLFGDRGRKAFNYQQADKFRQWLDWLAAKPGAIAADLPPEDQDHPLIIHIAGFAVAKPDGVHLLLPASETGRFAQSVELLKLDSLFDALAASPVKKKLLLLDLAHPVADPFNGILDNRVAAALDDDLAARKNGNRLPCPVLVSCGPGQKPLYCDPEGCSVFAFYVAEGLRGAADGVLDPATRDEVIKVPELARFVAARVERWARICQGARQTPMLHAPDDASLDMVVAYKPRNPEYRYDAPSPSQYPAELARGWQSLPDRGDPSAFARCQAELLRAERLWVKSAHSDRAEEAWRGALASARAAASGSADVPRTADAQKAAGARAARFRIPPTSALKPEALAELGKLLDAFLTATPMEEAKAKASWAAKAVEQPVEAARLVWLRAVTTERPERKEIKRWAEALPPKMVAAETILLDRLARFDFVQESGLPRPPEEAIAALVKAEAAVSRIAFAPDAGFAGLSAPFAQADANRREAEKALFVAKSLAEANTAGAKLSAAAGELDAMRKRLEQRQAARDLSNQTRAALLDSMGAAIWLNSPDFRTWSLAARSLKSLQEDLATAEGNPSADGSDWAEEAAALPPLILDLQSRRDAGRVAKWLKESPPRTTATDVAALGDLLAGAALAGESRGAAWNAWRTDLANLHASVRKQDQADDDAKTPSPVLKSEPPGSTIEAALRRAEASVLLLRLAGAAGANDCDGALRAAKADPGNVATWDKLGTLLNAEWLGKLPQQTREMTPATAARTLAVAPPELARYRTAAEPWPGAALAKADAAAQRRWLLAQLLADEPLRARTEPAKAFYDDIRREVNQP